MFSRRDSFFSPFLELPYFTREQLKASALKFSLRGSTFNSYTNKALKDASLIKLKKGYYVARPFYDKHKTDTSYLFFLANTLLQPSYVSLESALQHYGVFAEAVNFTVTSITPKLPRRFINRSGIYSYRNINEKLFSGFTRVKGNFEFVIAAPHKAIFDYLYYYTRRFTKNIHSDLLEELRIDADVIPPSEKEKLKILISRFTSMKIRI